MVTVNASALPEFRKLPELHYLPLPGRSGW